MIHITHFKCELLENLEAPLEDEQNQIIGLYWIKGAE